MLRLGIFGTFRVTNASGNEIPVKSKKSRALLAYLALPPGKPRSREQIMALLWSDRGDQQARSSLRQALSGLRKDLGEEGLSALRITDESLTLDPVRVIVEPASPGDMLLDGLHLTDPTFEEWLRDERLRHEDVTPSAQPPELPLPDKPSVAVLPFVNMSGDPEQEYFSDGITEDIITDLSRFRSLFVIARNSSFRYKDHLSKIQQVGRELGVRYVVEGSVRRADNRVRITAQLIEAESGKHLWAERYDRDLEDIFTVQDEVTSAIVTAVEPTVGVAERDRARRKPPESLDAWESYQRGLSSLYRFSAQENTKAQSFFRRAIELDPDFAPAHAGLAHAIYISFMLGFIAHLASVLGEARAAAQKAVTLDDNDALAHAMMGRIHLMAGELDEAISACETAIALNPNLAMAHYGLGGPLNWSGHHEEAIAELDEAARLSPRDPLLWHFLSIKAQAYMAMECYENGLELARAARRQPNAGVWAFSTEAVALAQLDRLEEAKQALERAKTIKSDFDLSFVANTLKRIGAVGYEYYLDGLKKAGLN